MDAYLEEPALFAKEKNIPIELVPEMEKKEIFNGIKNMYFDPNVLNRNMSWGERLLNSLVSFPYCSLNNYSCDTKKWLLEYIPQYGGEKKPLLVADSFSDYGSLYRFKFANLFSEVFYKTTLHGEKELFLTNDNLTYLVCYTELEHILAHGEIAVWIYNKAKQLGENVSPIWWHP